MLINLSERFQERVLRQPDHPAILGLAEGGTLSYGQLNQCIDELSEKLARAGVRAGTCVGLHCASGLDYIIATYAVWRCGGSVAPIPIELTAPEKREILRSIAIDFIVGHGLGQLTGTCRPAGKAEDFSSRLSAIRLHPERRPPDGLAGINAAFIRFTSGTTGAAKGVVLSHETILERIHAANAALALGPEDRVLWLLSMSYHFAVSIVAYLTFGATIVLPAGSLAAPLVHAADVHHATVIYGSPMHYALLADYDGRAALAALRLAISTTTALDRLTALRFFHRFERPVTQALGIIEVGLPCMNMRFAVDRPEAVGCVLPAYTLRLADAGLGPKREEILLRGKGLLDAYYEPWQTRDQIMPTGWFHTGDLGYRDSDGCLFLSGRIKEVISVMGIKFFPQEVEEVLTSHPQVAAACVSADQDPRFGNLTVATIVPLRGASKHLTVDRLRAFCRTRLTVAKIPHKFVFVDDLPRTPSGKLRHVGAGSVRSRSW